MKLKCSINGAEYDILQGCSFTDNFNETLDSGTIFIDQVPLIEGLKPYDDVFVYDSDYSFNGYYAKGDYVGLETDETSEISTSSDETSSKAYTSDSELFGRKFLDVRMGIGRYFLTGIIPDVIHFHAIECVDDKDSMFVLPLEMAHMIVYLNHLTEGRYVGHIVNMTLSRNYDHFRYIDESGNISAHDGFSYSLTGSFTSGGVTYEVSFPTYFSIDYSTITVSSTGTDIITGIVLADGSLEYKKTAKTTVGITIKELSRNDEIIDLDAYCTILGRKTDFDKAEFVWFGSMPYLRLYLGDETILINMNKPSESGSYSGSKKFGYDTGYDDSDELYFVNSITIDRFVVKKASNSSRSAVFYKHMLIDSFQRQRLNLGSEYDDSSVLYKYQINLMSETKRLEKTILPNVSITQPTDASGKAKRSCWEYMNNFVELYSPKYKKVLNPTERTWHYVSRFSVSDSEVSEYEGKNGIVTDLKIAFSNAICPEMTLSNPSLRDVLSQIMIVKDMIPVVIDGVIYGMDIGKTDLPVFSRDNAHLSFDMSSMSSDSYATDARREYSGALSQENSAHLIEYMGFRSPNSAFLSLNSMVLETRFPIYKVNSLYLCYYKKYTVTYDDGTKKDRMFLCKYDISRLVLQNEVRNALSENYKKFENYDNLKGKTYDEAMEFVSQFKLCTVGYSIGSNTISGWGTTYSYLEYLWFKNSKSYIENIIELLETIDDIDGNGTGSKILASELQDGAGSKSGSVKVSYDPSVDGGAIVPFENDDDDSTNIANKLKSVFFEMDYDAMYGGAIIHGKDNIDDDDVMTADNCSSSLSILETDGLMEKEKMDRISNETLRFTARYDDISELQELATIDSSEHGTNATIFAREYQIYDNAILANYTAMKDYILKNYYTSVWAKYRTYNLMSYGESIKRAENHREFVLLSKTAKYYETENVIGADSLPKLLSFLTPSDIAENGKLTNDSKINCGFIKANGRLFLSDINSFACGNSVCFNIVAYDNVSGGNYISSLSAELGWDLTGVTLYSITSMLGYYSETKYQNLVNDYKATQGWHSMVSDSLDPFMKTFGFYVCNLDSEGYFGKTVTNTGDLVYDDTSRKIMSLPLLIEKDSSGEYVPLTEDSSLIKGRIGGDFDIFKDNKEKMDFTYQFSYITDSSDILVSPWAAKLTDLVGNFRKLMDDKSVVVKYGDAGFAKMRITDTDKNDEKTLSVEISDDVMKKIIEELESSGSVGVFGSEYGDNLSSSDKSVYSLNSRAGIGTMYVTAVNGESQSFVMTSISGASLESGNESITANIAFSFFSHTETDTYFLGFIKTNSESSSESFGPYSRSITLSRTSYDEETKIGTYSATFGKQGDVEWWKSGRIQKAIYPIPLYDDTYWHSSGSDVEISIGIPSSEEIAKNMFVVSSTKPLRSNLVYNSYEYGKMPSSFTVSDKRVDEVFTLNGDGSMTVDASSFAGAKSVQYYYMDGNGLLRFVFGVNISGGDTERIYASIIGKRCMDVYDGRHVAIGKSTNYASESGAYGEGQYYTEG